LRRFRPKLEAQRSTEEHFANLRRLKAFDL
jgi:hypothetical protein